MKVRASPPAVPAGQAAWCRPGPRWRYLLAGLLSLAALLPGWWSGARAAGSAARWEPVASGAYRPGTVRGVADAGRLYVESNGLAFASDDAGQVWRPFVGETVWPGAITPDPTDPRRLYAFNPLRGAPLRSDDGGTTWTRVVLPPVQVYRGGPPAPLVTTDGAIWYGLPSADRLAVSWDGGTTWARLDRTFADLRDLVAAPADARRLWARDSAGWWRTDDAGATWVALPPVPAPGPALLPDPDRADALWLRAWEGTLWHSADAGATWTELPGVPVGEGRGVLALVPDPARPDRLYALTAAGSGDEHNAARLHVLDAGAGWREVPLPAGADDAATLSLPPGADGTVFLSATFALWRSPDGGATWERASGFNALPFRQVVVTGDRLLALHLHPDQPCQGDTSRPTSDRRWSVSRDGGATWTVEPALVAGEAVYPRELVVDPRDPARRYLYTADAVYRSRDGGATWARDETGLPAGFTNAALALDPFDPGRLWLGRTAWYCTLRIPRPEPRPMLWRSDDGGATWTGLGFADRPGAPVSAIGADGAHSGRLYVASDQLYRTDDAGATWATVPLPPEAGDAWPESVLVDPDPAHPATVWLGVQGRGLFRGDADGTRWERVAAVPAGRSVRLFAHPSRSAQWYAVAYPSPYGLPAADGAPVLYLSRDAGTTWTDVSGPFTRAAWPTLPLPWVPFFPDTPAGLPDRPGVGGVGGTWRLVP